MTPAPQLYLIRHGETAWSLTGQHTGRTDLPLTTQGRAMARALAPVLQAVAFTQVLCSPRLRAQDTCALAGQGAHAQTEPDLAEWDYGDYEGLRTAEIQAKRPGWDVWADGCPGGELPNAVSDRADRLIHRLQGATGAVALFTHGQLARALAARWVGLPLAQGRHLAIDPATIGLLTTEAAHPQRQVIALWNAGALGRPRLG